MPTLTSKFFLFVVLLEGKALNKMKCVLLQLLECGGNLFDAASIAVKAALFNTK